MYQYDLVNLKKIAPSFNEKLKISAIKNSITF
jgi:hypothetical protein